MPNRVENEFISYDLQDGILIAVFKEGITVDLPAAKEILELRSEFTKSGKLPALIDGSKLQMMSLTKEARDFLSTDQGMAGLKATAFVMSNPLISMIANFFLQVNAKKVEFPVKLFSKTDKALSWLNQFK